MSDVSGANNSELQSAAELAREAGATWLLVAEVMGHIPLLFDQPRTVFEHFASKPKCQSAVARLYHSENGYRTTVFDLGDQETDELSPFPKAIVGGMHFENTDMKRTPERIRVLPFNRMLDVLKHTQAMFSRDLSFALAYEFHRRLKMNDQVTLGDLVLQLIDKNEATGNDLSAARSIDKRLVQVLAEKDKWFRVAIEKDVVRYMLSLDDPLMPYYVVETPGEDFHLTFVVPRGVSFSTMVYREKVDEFQPYGVGPYHGNEVTAIDTDARNRGLPPLLNIERE